MKVIGLIGGMSWNSSAEYYRLINELVTRRRGGLHSASLILYSLDFDRIEQIQHEAHWDNACLKVIDRLVGQGAESIVLGCTELPLLIQPTDLDIPLFDTTRLHAEAAVNLALAES